MTGFSNEPLLELRRSAEREQLLEALRLVDDQLPIAVPVIVGGRRRHAATLESVDPGHPSRVVAVAAVATAVEIGAAVAAASHAADGWRQAGVDVRTAVVVRAAAALRMRRCELAALAVRECGKPWAEADADICEAIDFLEYYAVQANRLAGGEELIQLPGERNALTYRARGVVAVIAPWNFPFAIAAGMTAARVVTGNGVCLKPAEQSLGCALAIAEAFDSAGLPDGLLALLPGAGDVGAELARSPGVHTIAFTGSSAVGLEILKHAAIPAPDQNHLKRVVVEMGGKNCVIVDRDADLDEVVPAVLTSAFGFAGQKCSAASRLLVHEQVLDPLARRLREALAALHVGQAEEFGVDVPPLIESASCERVERVVAEAESDGTTVYRVELPISSDGFFAAPTLILAPPRQARAVREEIFGPVLTVEAVASVDEACEIVASQAHALTGGLFSRNPRVVADVASRTPVGNLYVNRAITGAMVGRQPFGGNRLSGTGTKAGGADYLLHFVEPVVVTENTVRHGLAHDNRD